METAHHLLASCRYTRRVWGLVAQWAGLPELKPTHWRQRHDIAMVEEHHLYTGYTAESGTHYTLLVMGRSGRSETTESLTAKRHRRHPPWQQ
jgi:hypothetical protein